MNNHWEYNAVTIPGGPYPQIALDSEKKVWFAWTEQNTVNGVGLAEHDKYNIVLAYLDDSIVKRKQIFNCSCYPRLKCICITDAGPIVLWIEIIDGHAKLIAGDMDGNRTALPINQSVWDVAAVRLPNGRSICGIITLEGQNAVLQFYDLNDVIKNHNFIPIEGLRIENVWSLSLCADDRGNVWAAYDRYDAGIFAIYAMCIYLYAGVYNQIKLPCEGFATQPYITMLDSNRMCVVWRQEKAWGKGNYDFTQHTQIKLAIISQNIIESSEVVPLPIDEAGFRLPFSPIAVPFGDSIRVFFRWFRSNIKARTLINDWGWQLFETVIDKDGVWHEPCEVSLDVGYADDPIRVVTLSERQFVCIYHSCSFDSWREIVHSHVICIAYNHGSRLMPKIEKSEKPIDIVIEAEPVKERRPKVSVDNSILKCYWGDMHRHSLISKCIPEHDGSYIDHIKYAIAIRQFDFYSITDHAFQIAPDEWDHLLTIMDAANANGLFAGIYGYEWTNMGHINLYFLDKEAALFGYDKLRWLDMPDEIFALCHNNNMTGRIMTIRHFHADALPYEHIKNNPGAFNKDFDWAMEAVQGRGYSPKAINSLLNSGLHFGFMGSTDHNRPPGHPNGGIGIYEQAITGIWVENISRQNVFDAFKQRRSFCTNGPKMAVYIKVNGVFMGAEVQNAVQNQIIVYAEPTTEISKIKLVKDGQIIAVRDVGSSDPNVYEFSDRCDDGLEHYYYAVIEQKPEPGLSYPGIAWTSPVWTKKLNL